MNDREFIDYLVAKYNVKKIYIDYKGKAFKRLMKKMKDEEEALR